MTDTGPRVRDRIQSAASAFPDAASAFLDATILAAWALDTTREALLADLGLPWSSRVGPVADERFRDAVERRARGVPVAAITGTRSFHALELTVGPGVLIPRPDSETLVELAVATMDDVARRAPASGAGIGVERDARRLTLHDCCTGSGAIGLAAFAARRTGGDGWHLVLSDIDGTALAFARTNAARYAPSAHVVHAALQEALRVAPADVVVANPPYLSSEEWRVVEREGWREPRIAFDGGDDGLDTIRELVAVATTGGVHPGGALLVEHGPTQASAVRRIGEAARLRVDPAVRDAAGRDRVTRMWRVAAEVA